ncbi:MAG: nitrogen fixation protein NifZ [Helicobacteraceae bacterium]|jgi:nitrogen fixation protein NifZ|nr:nitrogen fixation protein NifZ [Helicobacteraceae bacterium]
MSDRDSAIPLFEIGQKARLKTDIRADGTYSFAKMGEIIAFAGEEGYIRDIGTFLQVIRIYDVDFIASGRLIGCREDELESAESGDEIERERAIDDAQLSAHRNRHIA